MSSWNQAMNWIKDTAQDAYEQYVDPIVDTGREIAGDLGNAINIFLDGAIADAGQTTEQLYGTIIGLVPGEANTYLVNVNGTIIRVISAVRWMANELVEIERRGDDSLPVIKGKVEGVIRQGFSEYEEEFSYISDNLITYDNANDLQSSFTNSTLKSGALGLINLLKTVELTGDFKYEFYNAKKDNLEISDILNELDYGVSIVFNTASSGEYSLKLGINDFGGDPYSTYNCEISQSKLFTIPEEVEITGLQKISINVYKPEKLSDFSFQVKNFALKACGELPQEDDFSTSYKLELDPQFLTVETTENKEPISSALPVTTTVRAYAGSMQIDVTEDNLTYEVIQENYNIPQAQDGYTFDLDQTDKVFEEFTISSPEGWYRVGEAETTYRILKCGQKDAVDGNGKVNFISFGDGNEYTAGKYTITIIKDKIAVKKEVYDAFIHNTGATIQDPDSRLLGHTLSYIDENGIKVAKWALTELPASYPSDGIQVSFALRLGDFTIARSTVGIKRQTASSDVFTLALDNDVDIIVKNTQGNLISTLPTVSAKVYKGSEQYYPSEYEVFDCEPIAKDKWILGEPNSTEDTDKTKGCYTITKKNGTCILSIKRLPKDSADGLFKFIGPNSIEKTFTYKIITSEVDYDLIVTKAVVNTSKIGDNGVSISIQVKKTDLNGVSFLSGPNNDEPIDVKYDNGGGWTLAENSKEWRVPISKSQTNSVGVRIVQSSGSENIPQNFVWDEETIEIVNDGDPGQGIDQVIEYYLVSDQSTGITTSTQGWNTAITTPTKEKPYLWNYEVSKYADGSNASITAPVIIAYYTEDGRGIDKIENKYLVTNIENITKDTIGKYDWDSTPGVTNDINKYLWNYEIITYTDGSSDITDPAIIGTHGTKGSDGQTPYVKDGNWYIGSTFIGQATGSDGHTPYIQNGYWYINGVNQGVKAEGSDASVTYENMWSQFKDEKTGDGLFKFTVDGIKRIGINADLIRTGALCIGDNPSNPINNTFYASVSNKQVYIGGWTVEPEKFSRDNVFLSPTGIANQQIGINSNLNLVFKAGDNFGVDTNGKLYAHDAKISGHIEADSGKIASFDITENYLVGLAGEGEGRTGVGFAPVGGKGCWAIWVGGAVGDDGMSQETAYGRKAAFRVGHGGELIAQTAYISGEINATLGGSIGEVQLFGSDQDSETSVGSTSTKTWRIKCNDKFGVTKDGKLCVVEGEFSGEINATGGKIGDSNGWSIESGRLYSNTTFLFSDGPTYKSLITDTNSAISMALGANFEHLQNATSYPQERQYDINEEDLTPGVLIDESISVKQGEQVIIKSVPSVYQHDYKAETIIGHWNHDSPYAVDADNSYVYTTIILQHYVDKSMVNITSARGERTGVTVESIQKNALGGVEATISIREPRNDTTTGGDNVPLTVTYQNTENLDLQVTVLDDNRTIYWKFIPKTEGPYIIPIKYTVNIANLNCCLLNDGSAYFSAASINGVLQAKEGSIIGPLQVLGNQLRVSSDDGVQTIIDTTSIKTQQFQGRFFGDDFATKAILPRPAKLAFSINSRNESSQRIIAFTMSGIEYWELTNQGEWHIQQGVSWDDFLANIS